MEIRHISVNKNPIDPLSRQLVSDALVRKDSVKDANEEYAIRLRVLDNATDDQIQSALHKLFNSNNHSIQGPQGHSQCPQGNFLTTNEYHVEEQDSFDISLQLLHPLQFQNCN